MEKFLNLSLLISNIMEINIIGSTKQDFKLSKEEALIFGSLQAGVCYMKDNYSTLKAKETIDKNLRRQQLTLDSGHHSVYGHTFYNLHIEGIPKILAMIINNEKFYNTSEKSARYTTMKLLSGKEEELYSKWKEKLEDKILDIYPKIGNNKAKKLAMENARYLTSVFTPTSLTYTTDLRQLNYIVYMMKDFVDNNKNENITFLKEIKKPMKEFINKLDFLIVDKLKPNKPRELSLFTSKKLKKDIYDIVYATSYYGSFAMLAQAQRHRTLDYKIELDSLKSNTFILPSIIQNDSKLAKEWINDINSVKEIFPQGQTVKIIERGTLENFILKCYERLCGEAQLEIQNNTKETLKKYYFKVQDDEIKTLLNNFIGGPRCTFKGKYQYDCPTPCFFNKGSLNRLI